MTYGHSNRLIVQASTTREEESGLVSNKFTSSGSLLIFAHCCFPALGVASKVVTQHHLCRTGIPPGWFAATKPAFWPTLLQSRRIQIADSERNNSRSYPIQASWQKLGLQSRSLAGPFVAPVWLVRRAMMASVAPQCRVPTRRCNALAMR